MPDLFCTNPDPDHTHDLDACCECNGDHCCHACPVFVDDWPDSIDHPQYVQGFKDGYLSTRRNDPS